MNENSVLKESKSSSPIKVLLVEDNPGDARLIGEILVESAKTQFELIHVIRLKEALKSLDENRFDLVLLDLCLPDSYGLDTLRNVYAQTPYMPILILTGLNDEAIGIEAVKYGAQDYLIKGHVDSNSVIRSIHYALERHRLQSELRNLSLIDELTGLYNRRGFKTISEQHIKPVARTNKPFVLALFDLDGLKQINDTLGHKEGSRALTDTAQILRQTFRGSDIIARWGGDEFVILMMDTSSDSAESITSRLQRNFEAHNSKENLPYKLSISIGIESYDPNNPCSLDELLARADTLMYEQKRQKKMKGVM